MAQPETKQGLLLLDSVTYIRRMSVSYHTRILRKLGWKVRLRVTPKKKKLRFPFKRLVPRRSASSRRTPGRVDPRPREYTSRLFSRLAGGTGARVSPRAFLIVAFDAARGAGGLSAADSGTRRSLMTVCCPAWLHLPRYSRECDASSCCPRSSAATQKHTAHSPTQSRRLDSIFTSGRQLDESLVRLAALHERPQPSEHPSSPR